MHPEFKIAMRSLRRTWLRSGLLLSMLFTSNAVRAELQDISPSPCNNVNTTYAATPAQAIPANTDVEVTGASGNVFWGFTNTSGTTACSGGPTVFSCAGMTVTVPAPDVPVPATTKVTITGSAGALGSQGAFVLTATDAADTSKTCDGHYLLHVTSAGGGWGDPHLTTVDGIHYDFQSAGEFTALRDDKLEIQTRQTAVATATVPGANEYTGLRSCVSIYTAVAARVGSSRVSLQPNLGGQPDPSGTQLRVNGKLVTLTAAGIDLLSGGGGTAAKPGVLEGRIAKASTGNAIEITDSRGTQLVVTPAFWDSQGLWYLNVNVYQTSATKGTMGKIAEGSWLPALPDGTSLGPKPDSPAQRYQALYEKFADAWRVTDATSLFDYATGTNTATFTLDEWPRDNPQNCAIQGQTSVRPVPIPAAQEACSAVTNPAQKADCVFDVSVTGHTGFAKSYEAMQQFKPRGVGWQPPLVPGSQPPPTPSKWPWWWIVLLILLVIAILLLVARRRKRS